MIAETMFTRSNDTDYIQYLSVPIICWHKLYYYYYHLCFSCNISSHLLPMNLHYGYIVKLSSKNSYIDGQNIVDRLELIKIFNFNITLSSFNTLKIGILEKRWTWMTIDNVFV